MRNRLPSWKSALAAVAVAGAALMATAPPAMAQDGGGGPDPTRAPIAERVSGEVLPAVDRLQVTSAAGFLIDPSSGDYIQLNALTLSCTGFTVGSDGWIATAGHCVDPAMMAYQARYLVAQELAAQTGYDVNSLYTMLQNYVYVDNTGKAAPAITVEVLPETANPGDKPMDAKVVDYQPYAKGDTALLKVDGHDMISVEVAPGGPAPTGTPVMSIGYPGARDDIMDPSMTPTWKEGTVSSQQTQDGIAYTEITAEMGHGMSGGPTVNQQGQVIGINSQGTGDGGSSFNFVAPSSRLAEMMTRNGVPTTPSPVDAAYRTGLDLYYQGYYSDAVDQFDQVLALAPGNKAAVDYKNKAVAAHDQFGDKGLGLLGWGLIGGGSLFVLVIGGCVVGIVVRNRKRTAPVAAPQVDLAQPGFGLPAGYQVTLPQPVTTPQYQQQHGVQVPQQAPAGFGAAPFGQSGPMPAAPASPPVGFPAPTAPAAASAPSAAPAPRHAAPVAAPEAPAVAVATPPSGWSAPMTEAPMTEAPAAAVETSHGPGHCSNCGAARATGARFCGGCGVGLV